MNSVELSVDSLTVTRTHSNGEAINPISRGLLQKTRRLLQLDLEVKVQYTFREANSCDDALANMGCSMISNMMGYESCLAQIMHLLVADQTGVTLVRLRCNFLEPFGPLCNKKYYLYCIQINI